jgi:hypothetical protein
MGFDGMILGKSALWGCLEDSNEMALGNGLQWTHRNPRFISHSNFQQK